MQIESFWHALSNLYATIVLQKKISFLVFILLCHLFFVMYTCYRGNMHLSDLTYLWGRIMYLRSVIHSRYITQNLWIKSAIWFRTLTCMLVFSYVNGICIVFFLSLDNFLFILWFFLISHEFGRLLLYFTK